MDAPFFIYLFLLLLCCGKVLERWQRDAAAVPDLDERYSYDASAAISNSAGRGPLLAPPSPLECKSSPTRP